MMAWAVKRRGGLQPAMVPQSEPEEASLFLNPDLA